MNFTAAPMVHFYYVANNFKTGTVWSISFMLNMIKSATACDFNKFGHIINIIRISLYTVQLKYKISKSLPKTGQIIV